MAKILYGLCGEGLGHASRSRILINHLKNKHDIRIVAGGKAFSYMSKEFDDVYEIESPHFVYKGNEVKLFLTILRMVFQTFIKSPSSFLKVRRIIKEFKPDILITDAEPISFSASFFSSIKRVSIDNPQALLYRRYKIKFGEYFAWFALFIVVKLSVFGADKYLIYDFSDEQIGNPKVMFLKPLIQEGILKQKPTYGNHIFVYQTSISTEFITGILKKIDETFVIYGFNKELVDENLIFKRFNEDDFYHDIASAKAVVANGGFTVLSEALYLKKPIFSLPIRHQFEQVINGQFIEKLGAGVHKMDFCKEDLEDFLQNLNFYKKNLKSYNPGNQKETLKIIEDQIQTFLS
jgi:uncharacterized protein (TIGR00661 family)